MGLLIGVGNNKPSFPYTQYYGIQKDLSTSATACTRVGAEGLHQSLPIQSKMRRCLLADDGTVNGYLHATDSTKLDTGAAADLTGASGQVMVEIPKHYVKFELNGTVLTALFSEYALPGFIEIPKHYVSAYEAAMDRTNSKLSSVVNLTAQYRGGSNNASRDEQENTDLGKPATSISLTNFRAYAHNRGNGWCCNAYGPNKAVFWLYVCEYANFNCQLDFNATLDANGYHQGGLGPGVTTLDGTKWSDFNGYNPVIPCGTTNSLGNASGVVSYTMPDSYDTGNTVTVSVPSYRGIENPYGHIWKWTDGVLCNIQADSDGGKSLLYVAPEWNPAKFASSISEDYKLRGELPRTSNYVKELLIGEHGEMMPKTVGGSSSTYVGDYFYTNIPSSGEATRGVLFGGSAVHGASAGFADASTSYAPALTSAYFGSRLCFIPVTQ